MLDSFSYPKQAWWTLLWVGTESRTPVLGLPGQEWVSIWWQFLCLLPSCGLALSQCQCRPSNKCHRHALLYACNKEHWCRAGTSQTGSGPEPHLLFNLLSTHLKCTPPFLQLSVITAQPIVMPMLWCLETFQKSWFDFPAHLIAFLSITWLCFISQSYYKTNLYAQNYFNLHYHLM